MRPYRILISGGGTGGHVFPAIAIARALEKRTNGNVELLFVGAKGRMEMERIPKEGYEIIGLWISGIQRKLSFKNLSFPFKLISSLLKARRIIKKFRPDIAVGVGGYASGPTLHQAARLGVPTLIQEQNSYPGITNKILAKKVDRICVAFEGMERFFPQAKLSLTGNPVRESVIQLEGKKDRGVEYFGLERDRPTVLVVGGSLGAKTINEGVEAALDTFVKEGIQVIWQTGKRYFEHCKTVNEEKGGQGVKVHAFIDRMDLAYACADLVISRAGAIAVSELCLIQKPTIFVPSPNVAEDHQTKNARALADRKAARIIPDHEAIEKLGNEVVGLLKNTEERTKMSQNMQGIALKDSADAIASEIMNLIKPQ